MPADVPQSLDKLKATIQARGGIARGNRFGVHITHPKKMVMQGFNSALDVDGEPFRGNPNADPVTNHSFTDFLGDGRDTYILCTNVALPGKLITTTEAKHNHNLAKKPYSMATDEVNMTFLLTNDYYMKKYFDTWMEMIIDSTGNHYKTMYKDDYCADVEIQALYGNVEEQIGYAIKLENAYPRQISQVELGNDQESLMQVTVTWEYDNWRLINIEEGMEQIELEPAIPFGEPRIQEMRELRSAIPEGQPRVQDLSAAGQGGPPDFAPKQAIPHGEPRFGQINEIQNQQRRPAIPHGQPRAQDLSSRAQGGPPDFATKPAIPFGEPQKGQSHRIANQARQQTAISHGLPRGQRIPNLGSAIPHGLPKPQKRRFTWSFKI